MNKSGYLVDHMCHALTAPWIRTKFEEEQGTENALSSPDLCRFFEVCSCTFPSTNFYFINGEDYALTSFRCGILR